MSVAVYTDISLEPVECADCGVIFGLTVQLYRQRKRNHSKFYCPNGHSNFYPQENESEKLKRLLKEEQAKHANTQLELMATEKELSRLKTRAKNGVCPCCHRQFAQLARHVQTKHPDFVP